MAQPSTNAVGSTLEIVTEALVNGRQRETLAQRFSCGLGSVVLEVCSGSASGGPVRSRDGCRVLLAAFR